MFRKISELKDIMQTTFTTNDFDFIGVVKQNISYNNYLTNLYFIHKDDIYQISTCVDMCFLNKLTLQEFFIEVDKIYRNNNLFVNRIDKKIFNQNTPLMQYMLKHEPSRYDLKYNILYTDDFLICNNDGIFDIFLSSNFAPIKDERNFIEHIMNVLSTHFKTTISDFQRLEYLGYDNEQINQIIKSYGIYDIEPIINNDTSVKLMRHYNHLLDLTPFDLRDRIRNAIRDFGIDSVSFLKIDNSFSFVNTYLDTLEKGNIER